MDNGTSNFKLAPVFFGMDSNLGTLQDHAGEFTGESNRGYTRNVYMDRQTKVWAGPLDYKMQAIINSLNSNQANIENARFANEKLIEATQEADLETNLTIYPNPSEQVFQVDLTLVEDGEANYEVFDLSGKSLIEDVITLPKGNASIEINKEGRLTSGVYMIEILAPGIKETKRVIVK
jgi:hypothetical protein